MISLIICNWDLLSLVATSICHINLQNNEPDITLYARQFPIEFCFIDWKKGNTPTIKPFWQTSTNNMSNQGQNVSRTRRGMSVQHKQQIQQVNLYALSLSLSLSSLSIRLGPSTETLEWSHCSWTQGRVRGSSFGNPPPSYSLCCCL